MKRWSYACCPTTQFELRVKILQGSPSSSRPQSLATFAPVQPPVYALNWARRVTTEMSRARWASAETSYQYQRVACKVLKAAGLNQNERRSTTHQAG